MKALWVVALLLASASASMPEFLTADPDFTRDGSRHPSHGSVVAYRGQAQALTDEIKALFDYSNVKSMDDWGAAIDAMAATVSRLKSEVQAICEPLIEQKGALDMKSFELRERIRSLHEAQTLQNDAKAHVDITERLQDLSAELEESESQWGIVSTTRHVCTQVSDIVGGHAQSLTSLKEDHRIITMRRRESGMPSKAEDEGEF